MVEPLVAGAVAALAGGVLARRWRVRESAQAEREARLRAQEEVVDALAWVAVMKESAANMAESLNHASRLSHLNRALSVLDETALRETARRLLPRVLQVGRFSVFLYRTHRRQLTLFSHNHAEWEGLGEPIVRSAETGCGIMNDAISSRAPVVVPRFSESRYATGSNPCGYGPGPVICAPLLAAGQVIGVLNLNEFLGPSLTPGYLALVRQAADHFALALYNAHLVARINEQAMRDPLTGLYNRRHFHQAASHMAAQSRRDQVVYTILMLDMDGFKLINDKYGHATGDRMLKVVAAHLRASARKIDVPCRLGGDEFAFLLYGAARAEAGRLADRIRDGVAVQRHQSDLGDPVQLRVSIGLAESREGEPWESVLSRADRDLYSAKLARRLSPPPAVPVR